MPRVATAGLMFLAAIYVSPEVLGLYTWAILGFTLLQSVFDVAVRQVAVGALGTRSGARFLKRYRRTFASLGPFVMVTAILTLFFTHSAELRTSIWMLSPLVVAPLAMAFATKSVALLQADGKWKTLASLQSMAVLVSLALSLPVLLVTQSILGCVLQVTVVEVVFASAVIINVRSRDIVLRHPDSPPVRVFNATSTQFKAASAYSALGWGQGQSDRILVGLLAGTAKLGQYNLAWSVSRSLGDAVVNATVNVLRPKILYEEKKQTGTTTGHLLGRASMLIAGTVVITIMATELLLKPILGGDWSDALGAVPVMALCTLPQVFAYSATIYLTKFGKLGYGIPAKVAGLILALPIAVAATSSLTTAAWLAVARELFVMVWLLWLVRGSIPLRVLSVGGAWFVALAVAVLVLTNLR